MIIEIKDGTAVPQDVSGSMGLKVSHVLKEYKLQNAMREGMHRLLYALTLEGEAKQTAFQNALAAFRMAKEFPKISRTTLPRQTPSSRKELLDQDQIFDQFPHSEMVGVAIHELFGDLFNGRVTDATIDKLMTAIVYELHDIPVDEFYPAIWEISLNHGQISKQIYTEQIEQLKKNRERKNAPVTDNV